MFSVSLPLSIGIRDAGILMELLVDPRVQFVTGVMGRRLDRPLALDELSKTLNLSASRLRHIFKSETGTSPSQYLKSLRLRAARDLAATTFLSVKEIMVQVGIHDESHFVRDFERVHGVSPSQYRAAHRPEFLNTASAKWAEAEKLGAEVARSCRAQAVARQPGLISKGFSSQ